jgi:hypothetical protein
MHILNSILITSLVLGLLAACGDSSTPIQASAGTDFSINVGESPTFDGCASTGKIANYKWTIVSAPDAMSSYTGKVIREVDANCSFTLGVAMGVDEVGPWVIELEVRDGGGNTSIDEVQVEVVP